ncbi:MAG: hypothetical protein JRJ29_00500 [Deltaproteobacteria bacterium]|nr:hypothetical protein [Deltaproteobacteria bacterium]MBW2081648.1 hypothetical protein [Deltaproteobacteria bacterium]
MSVLVDLGKKVDADLFSAPLRVLKVPFSKSTSEYKTGIKFQAGVIIEDVRVKVTTAVASSTIDVGLDGSTHNDPDGLIDGLSCAAAGWPNASKPDASSPGNNYGPMMEFGADGKTVVANVNAYPAKLLIRGEAELTYTTSNHAVEGYIYVFLRLLEDD